MPDLRPVPRPRNPAAVAGLVVGSLAVLLRVAASGFTVLAPLLARDTAQPVSAVALWFAVVGLVLLLLFLATAVLGLVGVLLPGRPRSAASAVLGVGVVGTVTEAAALLLPAVVGAAL